MPHNIHAEYRSFIFNHTRLYTHQGVQHTLKSHTIQFSNHKSALESQNQFSNHKLVHQYTKSVLKTQIKLLRHNINQ